MSILGLLQVASAGMQIFGSLRERNEQAQAAEYNAQLMQQQAVMAQYSGAFEINKLRRAQTSMEGKQRAGYARSGVSSLSGSPLSVIASTAADYEIDIAATRFNTKVSAMRMLSQAEQDRYLARKLRSQGRAEAFSTLLSSASNMATSNFGGQIGQRSI
jgi:hypothetical protein